MKEKHQLPSFRGVEQDLTASTVSVNNKRLEGLWKRVDQGGGKNEGNSSFRWQLKAG